VGFVGESEKMFRIFSVLFIGKVTVSCAAGDYKISKGKFSFDPLLFTHGLPAG
jgi:hypothetical protein